MNENNINDSNSQSNNSATSEQNQDFNLNQNCNDQQIKTNNLNRLNVNNLSLDDLSNKKICQKDTESQTIKNFNINSNENENSSIDENNDNNSCDNNCEDYVKYNSNNNQSDDNDEENNLKKSNTNLDEIEYKLIERNELTNNADHDEFKSILYSLDTKIVNQKNFLNNYVSSKLVLTVDDNTEENSSFVNSQGKSFTKKINSDKDEDFIDEDFMPNQLNISNEFENNDTKNEENILINKNLKNEDDISNNINHVQNENSKIDEIKMYDSALIKNDRLESSLLSDLNPTEETINQKNNFDSTKKYTEIILNSNNLFADTNKYDQNIYNKILNDYNEKDYYDNNLIDEIQEKNENLNLISKINNFELVDVDSSNSVETDSDALRAFIWNETEAIIQQHEQISASGCGATSIINVLKALNHQFDYETVCSKIKINTRIPESQASVTTLAQYLFSRSVAGMNAIELIKNIENATEGKVSGRFFAFWPPREINLVKWLAKWIKSGAIPSALLNLQKMSVWGFIPDAWHHQMIYGVDKDSVYLTNPLEIKSVESMLNELTSDSILLVRSSDVIKRFNANNSNLIDLMLMKNHSSKERKRWFDMNVFGQVVSVLRESKSLNLSRETNSSTGDSIEILDINNQYDNNNLYSNDSYENVNSSASQNPSQMSPSFVSTNNSSTNNCNLSNLTKTHISIPASYVPGIVLFAFKDSNLFKEIMAANELPIR